MGEGAGATVNYFTHFPQQFNDVLSVGRDVYRQSPSQLQTQWLAQRERSVFTTDSTAAYPMVKPLCLVHYAAGNTMLPGSFPGPYGTNLYHPFLYEMRLGNVLPTLTEQVRYDSQNHLLTTTTSSTYRQQRLVSTRTRTSTGWETQRLKRLSDYAPTAAVTALRVNAFK